MSRGACSVLYALRSSPASQHPVASRSHSDLFTNSDQLFPKTIHPNHVSRLMSGVAPASPPVTLLAPSRPSTTQTRPLTSHTRRAEAAREAVKWLQVPRRVASLPSLICLACQPNDARHNACFYSSIICCSFISNSARYFPYFGVTRVLGQLALQPARCCLRQRNRSHSFCSRCQFLLFIKVHVEVFELSSF
jgi:hypothetical protein